MSERDFVWLLKKPQHAFYISGSENRMYLIAIGKMASVRARKMDLNK
jgi:hypothetical protein